MSFDAEQEILQDFLVEAGEIVEGLGEQLVDLEHRPRDKELLNGVFRAFHTVKGGAGFLSLGPIVDLCHCAEETFNALRQGECELTAEMMDAVMHALDLLQGMMAAINQGSQPQAAPTDLLNYLRDCANAETAASAPASGAGESQLFDTDTGPAVEERSGDITDEEFEQLLESVHGPVVAAATEAQAQEAQAPVELVDADDGSEGRPEPDEISDDEFEALLDQLHGSGEAPGVETDPAPADVEPEAAAPAPVSKPEPAAPAPTPAPAPAAAEATGPVLAAQGDPTVRVDTRRLDSIMNLVGELVLVRNRLVRLGTASNDEHLSKSVANLDVVTGDLQNAVMQTRMQPIKKVFARFPKLTRDLARNLEKQIDLQLEGEETDLDKNLVEALADPLVHLVRNAIDHGIESPAEREAAGKPAKGTVRLAAEQEGDHILVTIEDDGKGMDPEMLRAKAVEKGVIDADKAARLEARECFQLIFYPGFSTKQAISDISGRGVGMDVVKTRIGQLNGSIDIDSELGRGSRFRIRVPLTLAILPTLMVRVGERAYAMPLSNVVEVFYMAPGRANHVNGEQVVMVRGRPLPLAFLRPVLTVPGADPDVPEDGQVVVVHVGERMVGLVTDEVLGQEEVVIKPLDAQLHHLKSFAGATITGDGHIALILDVPGLMKAHGMAK